MSPIKLPDILRAQNGRASNEQDFGFREESGAVALALVLHDDAQDVWQRPDAGENADACARIGLGQHRDGSWVGPKAESVSTVYSAWESANGVACRMSVLS